MKNLRKKVGILFMVCSLVIGATGCGKNDGEEKSISIAGDYGDTGGINLPIVDKAVTISAMVNSNYPDLEKKLAFEELSRRTGIKLDIIECASSSYEEKLNVTIASGKLPDLMLTGGYKDVNKLAAQGALASINKYIDKLPNFKALMYENSEVSDIIKSYAAADSNLYLWPRFDAVRMVNVGFMYRKDIFDKNGIELWKDTEGFYKALKKLKEIYPDSTPYVSKSKDGIFGRWSSGWGLAAPGMYYDEESCAWKLSTTQAAYKDMLDFMKKLYKENLLDPEFLTDTEANFVSKITQDNKAFVINDWIGRMDMYYNQVKDSNPNYNLRYAFPIGPVGRSPINPLVTDYGTMIADNDHTEIAMKLMDYLTSPSGAELMTMGVKDVSYKVENDKIVYPQLVDLATISITEMQEKFGCYSDGICPRVDSRGVYHQLTLKEQEANDVIMGNKRGALPESAVRFTSDEESRVNEIMTNLEKTSKEFSVKYVVDDSYGNVQWNEWLQNAKLLKEDEITKVYNEAYAKMK